MSTRTVKEIRQLLGRRGLPTNGRKAELQKRLAEAVADEARHEAKPRGLIPGAKRVKGAPTVDPTLIEDSLSPFQFSVISGSLCVGQFQCIYEGSLDDDCFLKNEARNGVWTVYPCRVASNTYLWMASHGDDTQTALERFQLASETGEGSNKLCKFIERGSWSWWYDVDGYELDEAHKPLGSMRMVMCDTSVAADVAQWGLDIDPEGGIADGWGESFMIGNYQLNQHAVHIKDPNQPEDYNLGWFIYDDRLLWSTQSHLKFSPEFVSTVFNFFCALVRLGVQMPAPIRQYIISLTAPVKDTGNPELVAFIWDPHYGGMSYSDSVTIGGLSGALTKVEY